MSTDSTDVRQIRLAQNQALFRSVNERVEKLAGQFVTGGPIGFVCECAIEDCGTHIHLEKEQYEAIRENPTRFFVLPGHVFPEVESVVDDLGEYLIVEKFGAGGRVAAATDPRHRQTSSPSAR